MASNCFRLSFRHPPSFCRAFFLFSALYLVSESASSQRSRTIHVPRDRPTIQSAINAARVGDTVLVEEGLYYENVRIRRNLVLASRFIVDGDTSHISRTIIDGSRPHDRLKASVVTIQGPTDTTCVLAGFTIRGGSGTYSHIPVDFISAHWIGGGGVYIVNAGARIAYNAVVKNILSTREKGNFTFGAGIASVDTSNGTRLPIPPYILIEHNWIMDNTSTGEGAEAGGIEINQPGTIRRNFICGNKVFSRSKGFGGGIYTMTWSDYDVHVDGNYVCHNTAGIGGGILVTSGFVRRGRAIFTNNVIAKNQATEVGGGCNIAEESYAMFIGNTIVGNKAMSTGGGINVPFGVHAVLVNNIIWKNTVDQVSMWGTIQSAQNLIEGGFPGRNNFDVDPEFLPGDSLFRLSPNSPCLGTGLSTLWLSDQPFSLPQWDILGSSRPLPANGAADIGAVESPLDESAASRNILKERRAAADGLVKLTVIYRQIGLADRNADTHEIVRAGLMNTTIVVNDSIRRVTPALSNDLSFTLPPENNLLEVEIMGRSTDETKGLNVFFWLEGSDPHVSELPKRWASSYHYYSRLRPGEYRIVFQPQDQEGFIGHTNRVSVGIIVLPYWYQQWWAYGLYGIGVVAAAFSFFRVRLRRSRLEHDLAMERLGTEKLAEIDRLKSRFFANVSHEFRTPLSLLLGPVEQLQTSETDPARKRQFDVIRRNAERLLRMVNLLLQFARIESGTLKLRVSLQPVPHLVRRIVSSFSTAAVKKGVGLHVDIEPPAFEGYVDSEKIEHVLENLLSNAIKYTPFGGRVDVRTSRAGTDLFFSVTDTGTGIPSEHLPHLFERFYRVDSSHQYEGTGIGLSLSKELVEMHHGIIELQSTPGVGTVVTVRLPLSGYQESEIIPPLAGEQAALPMHGVSGQNEQETLAGENVEQSVILIVEDNDDAREYLRSRLPPGYEVIEARSGLEAWKKACQRIPDIVVSDVMMPEMSGYELCAKLKQDQRTSHIPVILLTALADRTDKIEGLQTGADDYLVKPFDAQELLARVQNLVKGRKSLQEKFRASVPLKPGEVAVKSLDDRFLAQVRAVVENHIADEHFSVEQFAGEVFLSRAQLHRKIKALTGFNATEFIRYLRLHRAKSLLEQNAGTVADVAYQTGFGDPNYFTRVFKQQFDILPSEVKNAR